MDTAQTIGLVAISAYFVSFFGGLVIFAAGSFLKSIGLATVGFLMLLFETTCLVFVGLAENDLFKVIGSIFIAVVYVTWYALVVFAIAKKERTALQAQPIRATTSN